MMWSTLAGSKAIHQVFGGERSTTVDVCTGTAAMKFVSGVLGVLLLHENRYSLEIGTNEDELIVKFQSEYMQCIVAGLLIDTNLSTLPSGTLSSTHVNTCTYARCRVLQKFYDHEISVDAQ